ncbi:translation initiation factor IF-2 [Thermophagus xiamenensis]|uniref:Translation initiation factor IF-2 n=1 Tax=Thermophagus xiamenensis TaxID=385682 RepID=A0A1I1Y627_9BACT|nr:translation initiation factor IF-2 [Thermophagus xiamenensis]SFE14772.1 bacterial translation initiation factor 2 (bIF-2) [Thermophagus xiamenensis]
MAVGKRLSKIAKECNVGISTIVEFLHKKGFEIESNPNTKVSEEMYDLLKKEYRSDLSVKIESQKLVERKHKSKKVSVSIDDLKEDHQKEDDSEQDVVDDLEVKPKVKPIEEEEKPTAPEISPKPKLSVKVVGKINLDKKEKTEDKEVKKETQTDDTASPSQAAVMSNTEEKSVGQEAVVADEVVKEEADVKEEKQSEDSLNVEAKTELKSEEAQHSDEAVESNEAKGKELKKESLSEISQDKDKKETPVTELESRESETVQPPKEQPSDLSEKTEGEKLEAQSMKEKEPRNQEVVAAETKEGENKPTKPETAEISHTAQSDSDNTKKVESTSTDSKSQEEENESFVPTKVKKLTGPTVVGKIELPVDSRSSDSKEDHKKKKKKRKRIRKEKVRVNIDEKQQAQQPHSAGKTQEKKEKRKKVKAKKRPARPEVSEEDVQKQIKETLARLTSKGKSKAARHRRDKRDAAAQKEHEAQERMSQESKVLKVTEFLTANELANLMDVQVNQVIATCMSLGLFVSINQRLDAETITLVAEEYGYKVEFISVEAIEAIEEEEDKPEDLKPRPPIITVMGHVDHGKTSLLDHIRNTNVIAGEAGGITQHIGAYNVKLDNGREITFLDTPGHEAFTAMRARGAQVTDIAIIIVAADDNVMPQTVEAINHASAAGVPIVFAINKIDKPNANPDRVKEELAKMNYLVEEWGGKYQSQDISAKTGLNVDLLLEKVLLEADLLELKANPNKPAVGSVIESSLDRGRGYVATLLVQSGTLKTGDLILSGQYYGHVKAMFNERNQTINEAGPSQPVLVLGLNGAPQAGEKFHVMKNEREAKELATKRSQLQREQGLRTQKHITLDEIGRRIAIGNFQELNLVVKGDVDGSIEALADSLIKLSTEEIQVNVIHKAVGQISESDIMLAAASNAIVIGFQVRPSLAARRLAEKEEIDIRLYSIIYDAIEEIKSAMEGMLSPEIKEQIIATLEIRETFKISKVGTVAGCMVKEGKIKRSSKVRIIRDGIVIYTGELGSLKRFKDDVKEVAAGYECGLNIKNFNDIKVGDVIEAFEEVEVSRTL